MESSTPGMNALHAVITIGIDPEIDLGPVTVAWHGLTIALGILAGGWVGSLWLRQRGMSNEPLYVWRAGLDRRYLDAVAFGLPLGVAVGRIGDVINGEHYGARSDFLLAVRNSHPEALTPDNALAYHNGGLYEVLLATAIFAIMWSARQRLPRVGDLAWLVLGLFSLGRSLGFFLRDDSPDLAPGLNNAQWTSAAMLVAVVAGWTAGRRPTSSLGPAHRPSAGAP